MGRREWREFCFLVPRARARVRACVCLTSTSHGAAVSRERFLLRLFHPHPQQQHKLLPKMFFFLSQAGPKLFPLPFLPLVSLSSSAQFYNIEKPRAWVTVTGPNAQTYTTKVGIGLDPEWEEESFFTITDAAVDKIEAVFFIKCEKNGRASLTSRGMGREGGEVFERARAGQLLFALVRRVTGTFSHIS
jgi:hypothetical protein